MENVIVEVLHMFMRITDRLQLLLHKNLEQMDCTFSTNLEHHNLNFKKFVDFLESIGIRKPFRKEKNDFILRDLNGVEKIKLLNNIDLCALFPDLNKVSEKNDLWKNFRDITSDAKNDIRMQDLKQRTKNWYASLAKVTFTAEITPYCHIFGTHLHKQVDYLTSKGISFNRFSMQGLEKQNDFFTQYYMRSTNKRADYIAQIMMKRSRIEIITFHPDLAGLFRKKKEQAQLRRVERSYNIDNIIELVVANHEEDEDYDENVLFEEEEYLFEAESYVEAEGEHME